MDFMGKSDKKENKLQEALKSTEMELPQPTKKGGLFGKFQQWKASRAKDAKKVKEEDPSVRGLLKGRIGPLDLLKLPSKTVAKEFAPYLAPVTVTQIGRVSGYVAMSHVVSSSLGTVSMAAQQVIVSFFYCLCPIADSLSLTAQSFLPGISERKPSKERAEVLRRTGRNFMKAGGVFGMVMAAMIGLLPILSRFFTADPMVVSLVNLVVPLLVVFFSVHGVLCASEGVLLGQKDLGFLGKMYGSYFFAVPFFMLRVKRAALSGVKGINLSSVWTVFLGYQLFRLCAWVARVEMIQRKTDRNAPKLEVYM
jgi:Na+-driven multidrug efflux pump